MADLGQAYVQIVPKATGISREISNLITPGATSAGEKAGSGIGSGIKKAIIAAGVGTAVTGVIKSALDEGGALQQSYGGLETIYGDAAEAAKKYAQEAAKAGISANSYAEQAVSFGASLKQAFAGDTTKAVEAANTAIMDMTDNAAKMGTPIESIQNAYQGFAKQNYTMLDNLKLGYGGTKTEMERLLADAEKLSGQKYDISNLGDVYDAIHVIQEDLGLTGVAAAEAEGTFTGSFGAMKASLDNFLGALTTGEGVDESLNTLIGNANTFLTNNLLPMLGKIGSSIISAIPTLLDSIWESVFGYPIDGDLSSFMDGIMDFFFEILPQKFSELWEKVFGEPINIDLESLFGNIGTAISDLVAGVSDVVSEFTAMTSQFSLADTIAAGLQAVLTALGTAIRFVADHLDIILPIIIGVIGAFAALKVAMAIGSIISGVSAAFSMLLSPVGLVVAAIAAVIAIGILLYKNWDQVKEWLVNTWEAIKTACVNAWNAVKEAVMRPIENIKARLQLTWNLIKLAAITVWNILKTTASNVWNNIKNAVMNPVNTLKNTLTNVWNTIKRTTTNVWNGIKKAITDPIETAKNIIKGAIDTIRGILNGSGFELPRFKLPHFRIDGGELPWGIGGKGRAPSIGVDWYAKGGVFDAASIIGVGEAGPEAVVPLSGQQMMPFAKAIAGEMGGTGTTNNFYITVDGSKDSEEVVNQLIKEVELRTRMAW